MTAIALKPDYQRPRVYVFEHFQRLDSEPGRGRMTVRSHAWQPPTDVYETEEAIVVRVEIAGMRETGFSIVLDGRLLSIRGFRADTQERRAYHQMEIRFGEFISEVDLPYQVAAEKVEAVYEAGLLRIVLPKLQATQVHIQE